MGEKQVPKRVSEQSSLAHVGSWHTEHSVSFLPTNLASTKQQMKLKNDDDFRLIFNGSQLKH